MKRLSAAGAVIFFVACSSLVEVQQRDVLYFGTSMPHGVVNEIEWRKFVNEVITPRFDGFTEWPADGHWKSEHEATHVVEIIHPDRSENDRKVREIVIEYKRRFNQQAVLVVRDRVLATLQ